MITTAQVKLLNQGNAIADYTKITELSDLPMYFDNISELCVAHFTKVLRSGVPPEKWDHCYGADQGASIFGQAVMMAQFKENNPIYNLDSAIAQKLTNFANQIIKGETILVNKKGGWCMLNDTIHEIVSERPFSFEENKAENVIINDNTRYINLENDPMLEAHTKDYLGRVDPNYSYITNLRAFSVDELTAIFAAFKKKGGQTVYVYTTGSDVPQMHDYAQAIINADLPQVEFEFNAGFDERFNQVFTELRSAGVTVTWKNV